MTTQRHSDGPEALFQRRADTLRFPQERRRSTGRLGQWLVAVLLVVTSVTAAAWLYMQKGSTTEVLVVSRAVAVWRRACSVVDELGTTEQSVGSK